jgi:uncharacterized membrane protein
VKELTENERLMASVILIFITYFGLDSLLFLFTGDESGTVVRNRLGLSFVVGMASGIGFYLATRKTPTPETPSSPSPNIHRSMTILERALSEDEMLLIEMVRDAEKGLTQDSIKFRTGFSKSKVSALILNLEKKGLIQREKLGKTYNIFLSELLK